MIASRMNFERSMLGISDTALSRSLMSSADITTFTSFTCAAR